MADLDREVGGLRCRDVLPRLSEYVDADLPHTERRRVDQHLERCPDCSKFGREFQSLIRGMAGRTEAIDIDVDAGVLRRLRGRLDTLWAVEDGQQEVE